VNIFCHDHFNLLFMSNSINWCALVAGFSPWSLRFNPRQLDVIFMVDEMSQQQGSL
jgi:hypothetical protein